MADDNNPVFKIQRIYMKDLLIDIPHAPQIFFEEPQPTVEVSLDTGSDTLADLIGDPDYVGEGPSYDPMEPWPIVKGETYVHVNVNSCGVYTVTNCGSDNRVKMQGEWVNGVTYRHADLSDETHYTRTEADFRAGFLPADRRGK